jgi:hypothetical protein
MSQTYPFITSYDLKGIHLTLDSWSPWQKEDGWKMTLKEIKAALSSEKGLKVDFEVHNHQPLQQVKAVPDLEPHLTALEELFAPAEPPTRSVHPSSTAVVLYGFGDASGHGFGLTS